MSLPQSAEEKAYLAVGKLRRPHGVQGEILMDVLTDFPERLERGMTLFVGEEHHPLRVRSLRSMHIAMLVAFDGFDTPETVGELRNEFVYVPAADRPPLPEGEFYYHQLIGLRVVDEAGQLLGILVDFLETSANDILVVRPEAGREILIPVVDEFVREIAVDRGEIRVHVIPGLLGE